MTVCGQVFNTNADADGFLTVQLGCVPKECLVEWGQNGHPGSFLYSMNVFLNLNGLSEVSELF